MRSPKTPSSTRGRNEGETSRTRAKAIAERRLSITDLAHPPQPLKGRKHSFIFSVISMCYSVSGAPFWRCIREPFVGRRKARGKYDGGERSSRGDVVRTG